MFKFVVVFFLHKFHPKFTEKFLDKILHSFSRFRLSPFIPKY